MRSDALRFRFLAGLTLKYSAQVVFQQRHFTPCKMVIVFVYGYAINLGEALLFLTQGLSRVKDLGTGTNCQCSNLLAERRQGYVFRSFCQTKPAKHRIVDFKLGDLLVVYRKR